ncbi:MAG TPA: zinc ribbon domain-containing protein [Candidatus Bathyarchaeia archaeon]|nr:zinc ribbon domain-containing protein [Candidatus Bathyarchaeia archaeon]
MPNVTDDIIVGHTIAKEFVASLSSKKQAKFYLPGIKDVKVKSQSKLINIITTASFSICCLYIIFLLFFYSFVKEVTEKVTNIVVGIFFGILLLTTFFAYVKMLKDSKRRRNKSRKREKIELSELMTEHLQQLELLHPKIFTIVKQSFDIALEDGTKENFAALTYSNILSELTLSEADLLLKEKTKRLIATIAHGNYIIESLDLLGLANDIELYDSLQTIILGFNELIINEESLEIQNSYLLQEFREIKQNFYQINQILTHIKLYEKDKFVSDRLQKDAKKLRKITKTKPIAKTNISFTKTSQDISKDELLSTITALDESVVEIRTRAGTYYTSVKNIQKDDPRKQREIELLTDKELLVKQEVITSTLDLLEQEKQNIPEKEYQKIKNENLSALFTTKNVLEKRKGLTKQVICPNCQAKNSSIQEFCKNCNKELPYCIVCLNSLGVGNHIKTCPHCQSIAHSNHFDDWLTKSKNCPYCKREIKDELVEIILK